MIDVKSVRRAVVLTTALAMCAAPAASARVADAPLPGGALTTHLQARNDGAPARVDAIGSPPRHQAVAVAVPITQPTARKGFDWASAAIGVGAVLSLILLGVAGWSIRTGGRTGRRRSDPSLP